MGTADEKEAGQIVAFAKYGAKIMTGLILVGPLVFFPAKLWLDANYEGTANAKTVNAQHDVVHEKMFEKLEKLDRQSTRWCERTSTNPSQDCQ